MIRKIAKAISFFLLPMGLYAAYEVPVLPEFDKIDLQPQEDELLAIERMIELTAFQQNAQIELKKCICEMKKNKELFLKGEESKLHAKLMLESASQSYYLIRKYHLSHLFSSDFMEELALFNQIGKHNE